jgi:hypothetical protein
LFTIIVQFPFIFIYTCSIQFIVIFYLTYVMFLLTGHRGLSAAIGVDSWGAARSGAVRGSGAEDGRSGEAHMEEEANVEQEAPEEEDRLSEYDSEEEEEGAPQGGGQQQ